MHAALHELQQRLRQCHNGPSLMRVGVTAGPVPTIADRIRRKLFQRGTGFYTIFTFFGLWCGYVNKGREATFPLPSIRSLHMDLMYLTIAAMFFLLTGWLISALERL